MAAGDGSVSTPARAVASTLAVVYGVLWAASTAAACSQRSDTAFKSRNLVLTALLNGVLGLGLLGIVRVAMDIDGERRLRSCAAVAATACSSNPPHTRHT